jgi:RHS repeat-associated protein
LRYGQDDKVRQKFTGYQHDEETELDFAEARMYQSLYGRFTAIDPLLASGKSADPQTFNRYVYVLNNPLILTDPTGLQSGEKPIPEEPGVFEVVTIWFREVQKALQDRANYLLNGATNLSNYDAAQFDRAQNRIRAINGDGDAINALGNRVVANKGPSSDRVLQTTADGMRLGMEIVETGLTINTILLGVPVPGGSNPVATNRGVPVSSAVASESAMAGSSQGRGTAERLSHIFGKSDHNLDTLVEQFGSQREAFDAVQHAANQALRNGTLTVGNNGVLPTGNDGNIINVNGTAVRLIGGRVVDGQVEISSFSRFGLH